jgi:hypothetical protein
MLTRYMASGLLEEADCVSVLPRTTPFLSTLEAYTDSLATLQQHTSAGWQSREKIVVLVAVRLLLEDLQNSI